MAAASHPALPLPGAPKPAPKPSAFALWDSSDSDSDDFSFAMPRPSPPKVVYQEVVHEPNFKAFEEDSEDDGSEDGSPSPTVKSEAEEEDAESQLPELEDDHSPTPKTKHPKPDVHHLPRGKAKFPKDDSDLPIDSGDLRAKLKQMKEEHEEQKEALEAVKAKRKSTPKTHATPPSLEDELRKVEEELEASEQLVETHVAQMKEKLAAGKMTKDEARLAARQIREAHNTATKTLSAKKLVIEQKLGQSPAAARNLAAELDRAAEEDKQPEPPEDEEEEEEPPAENVSQGPGVTGFTRRILFGADTPAANHKYEEERLSIINETLDLLQRASSEKTEADPALAERVTILRSAAAGVVSDLRRLKYPGKSPVYSDAKNLWTEAMAQVRAILKN